MCTAGLCWGYEHHWHENSAKVLNDLNEEYFLIQSFCILLVRQDLRTQSASYMARNLAVGMQLEESFSFRY